MTISTILNLLIVGFALTSVLSITATNSVISVIFLISTFVQVALYLILLGINFIAISYIVIYVGAIAVLFLFVIMMINIKLTDVLETGNNYTKNLPLAINIIIFFIFILFTLLPLSLKSVSTANAIGLSIFPNLNNINFFKDNTINQSSPSSLFSYPIEGEFEFINAFKYLNKYNLNYSDLNLTFFSEIEVLGQNLYTYGAILLIILSIILLLAMFATIVLSKNNKHI